MVAYLDLCVGRMTDNAGAGLDGSREDGTALPRCVCGDVMQPLVEGLSRLICPQYLVEVRDAIAAIKEAHRVG